MLEIQNVSKTFNAGTVNQKIALNGLNLKLNEGDFVTVIGGNGAGKSTILKLLSGLKKPYRGEIRVSGTLAMLPQNPQALFVKKTVREDLFEIFSGSELPKAQQEERVSRMVQLVGDDRTSSSAWPLPAVWSMSRRSCCWMSLPRDLMRSSSSSLRKYSVLCLRGAYHCSW